MSSEAQHYMWQHYITMRDINSGKLSKARWFLLSLLKYEADGCNILLRCTRWKWALCLGHVLREMTDAPDTNLCPRMLWTPVFPRKILPDPPGLCRSDLLGPEVSSLPQPLTHTLIHAENPRPEGPKREMAPVIFPLLTGTLQHSLSQSPRGDDIKQRKKPFTFYSLLPQRAHISFLTLSILFFIHFSHIPPIYPSLSLYSLHLFLCFIKFDILTMLFKYQHQKICPLRIFWSKQKSSSYTVGVIFQWNNLPLKSDQQFVANMLKVLLYYAERFSV